MSIHDNCEHYHQPDDLCLCFFQLTTLAFNVSKKTTSKCLGEILYKEG